MMRDNGCGNVVDSKTNANNDLFVLRLRVMVRDCLSLFDREFGRRVRTNERFRVAIMRVAGKLMTKKINMFRFFFSERARHTHTDTANQTRKNPRGAQNQNRKKRNPAHAPTCRLAPFVKKKQRNDVVDAKQPISAQGIVNRKVGVNIA
jgi:hypothetical protein